MRNIKYLLLLGIFLSFGARAEMAAEEIQELDPFAPNVNELLEQFDKVYEEETGLNSHLEQEGPFSYSGCYRQSCRVWALVEKSEQRLYLYVDGAYYDSWKVSTGAPGHDTPDFDTHPDGRIYDRYTSTKYPDGDYAGLGNMPYAVFIRGGFALHGTPQGNWSRLGRRASHGCIRQHPDHAYNFNRLVRSVGVRNVWITVR